MTHNYNEYSKYLFGIRLEYKNIDIDFVHIYNKT